MKPIYKSLLLLAATSFIMTACDGMSGDGTEPDEDPTEETVTLRLKSAVADSDAKTSINDIGTVLWNPGDKVFINGEPYEVMPDEFDPSCAIVEDVRASDEYFASYPEPLYETGSGYYEVSIPEYQSYVTHEGNTGISYGIYANPMIAYGTSEELQFFNIGAVLCLTIDAGPVITGISVTSNDGSPMAGSLLVPVDEVVTGFYSDRYMWSAETGRVYMECLADSYSETYACMVVAPEAYSEGFTAYVRDDSGNVAIQSTYEPQDMFRNTFTQKEPFKFTAVSAPEIVPGASSSTVLEYEIHAQRGAYLKTAVLLKSDYEAAFESGFEDFAYEILGKADAVQVGSEGMVEFSAREAYNIDLLPVGIEPDTEYVIVSLYSDSVDIFRFTLSEAAVRTESSSVDPEPSSGGVSTEDFTVGEELQWQ